MPLLIAALAAAAPLFAMASERWGGLNPCELCLWQRWPYWIGAVLALLAFWLPRRLLLTLAGLAILGSGAFAVVHVGVEAHWWPSPFPGCTAPTAGSARSVEDMLAGMAAAPSKPCDEPTYLIPALPLSMAGMNLIYALALGGLALREARRRG
ncbi:disulfide bond formation protein B [Roseomonas sp. M0104]|uniref:Disulfide bond formation protein B n=1 Tax=Teichococcus coralli TaxID=2545983 RepID=A0A845BDU2_9PROT|nr:disulfide bond formation protein B [Pseudoroseomonas coralli]MXP63462.1 disulfide bond formation protein B [Pseudoroseomonas coralli]